VQSDQITLKNNYIVIHIHLSFIFAPLLNKLIEVDGFGPTVESASIRQSNDQISMENDIFCYSFVEQLKLLCEPFKNLA
jgi:hypothetical protein